MLLISAAFFVFEPGGIAEANLSRRLMLELLMKIEKHMLSIPIGCCPPQYLNRCYSANQAGRREEGMAKVAGEEDAAGHYWRSMRLLKSRL